MVTRRYEIQDILEQDANGIVFHAVERDGGRDVVLRRFFPFGANGGGLDQAEREAYAAAVENLRRLEHPALRKVLDGGCDPVDGMPFLITEWVEGEQLSTRLEQKPLSAPSARALLEHAIGASRELAKVLGKDAVWVETAADAIILSEGEGGRGVTFWICPFRWLGENGAGKVLLPLAELAEEALHWRGRAISDAAGEGLGAWVKAIRANPERWTLEEARTALETVPQPVDAGPASTLGVRAEPTIAMPLERPGPVKLKQKKSTLPWVAVGMLVLAVGGLFAALKMRKARTPAGEQTYEKAVASPAYKVKESVPASEPANVATPAAADDEEKLRSESPEQRVARRARELQEQAAKAPPLAIKGEPAEISGVVEAAEASGSGKTRYLRISDGATKRWAGFQVAAIGNAPEMKDLESLVGKKVRIRGTWRSEKSHRREVLHFKSRKDIETLD